MRKATFQACMQMRRLASAFAVHQYQNIVRWPKVYNLNVIELVDFVMNISKNVITYRLNLKRSQYQTKMTHLWSKIAKIGEFIAPLWSFNHLKIYAANSHAHQ